MTALTASKTPISSLQEYCQRISKTPQYDLIAIEGRAHQPQFVYRCTVGEVSHQGQGGSKKAAKHNAADAMLAALKSTDKGSINENGKNDDEDLTKFKTNQDALNSSLTSGHDGSNPVGTLQELVVARGWRLPVYSLHAESGPAHKKEFIMKCTVETFCVYGSGSAKKVAKRKAANAMYDKLNNLPADAKPFIEANINSKRVTSFDVLKNSEGNEISEPLDINLDKLTNYKSLCDLGKTADFIVECHDINYQTTDGLNQCLLVLTTQPHIVVHGVGATKDEAHSNAARNAVMMLHIFAKRGNNINASNPEA